MDVCFGAEAGPTRRHYPVPAAVIGADDRGAMVLGAALECHDLLQAD